MREVKPTQKPVPSSDIKDLFFNSGLLDIWATSLEHKYIDRFGNCHLTAAGMEWLFKELVEKFKIDMNTAIVAAGYITIDSFQQGANLPNNELTQRNHILRDESTGEYYRWDGDLPKQVPAGSTPQSTGGIGKGAWVGVGDASLREDLNKNTGATIVKTKSGESVQYIIDSIKEKSALNDALYAGDYNSIQEALDLTKVHSETIVSPNVYTENVTLSNKNLGGFGDASMIMPQGNKAALLIKNSNPQWTYRYLSNLSFRGSADIVQTGVEFDPDNSLSGRIAFNGISFNRLDKSIHKPSGNIGNTYQHISAGNVNYFMYAEAKSNMHIGADSVQNSHFETIHKYAFYLDGKKEKGGIGGFCIRDSIIEASNGGGLYVKSKGDTPITPILLSNVWFERMCNSPTVNVDNVEQKPQILKFIDNKIAYVEYSSINQIELINSNLVMYGCNFDNRDLKQSIVVDDNSSIICYDAFMNGAGHVDVIVESIAQQNGKINSVGLSMRGSNFVGRVNRPASGIIRQAVTFDKDQEYRFDGDKRTVGTRVSDGVLSEFCQEFNVASGTNQAVITGLTTQITSGKWYAWGVNAKKIAGDGRLDFLYGITLGSVYMKEGEWVRTFGYAQATRSDSTNIMVRTTSSHLKFRISDLFIVEFNTEREARLFSNSKVSINDM